MHPSNHHAETDNTDNLYIIGDTAGDAHRIHHQAAGMEERRAKQQGEYQNTGTQKFKAHIIRGLLHSNTCP